MKLFVDTSAWVAYYDADDRWHAIAKAAIDTLLNQRVTFVTSDYVLDEAITF
jgi:predicted nucleic acid-binding protein